MIGSHISDALYYSLHREFRWHIVDLLSWFIYPHSCTKLSSRYCTMTGLPIFFDSHQWNHKISVFSENIFKLKTENVKTRRYLQGIQLLLSTHQSPSETPMSSMRSSNQSREGAVVGVFLVSSEPKSLSPPWEVPIWGRGDILGGLRPKVYLSEVSFTGSGGILCQE